MTRKNETVINELTVRELEKVNGGKSVEMMGDTWEATGDGHPTQTTHHWGWPLNYLLG